MIDYALLPLNRYEEIPTGQTVTAYDSTKYRGKEAWHEDIELSSRNRPHLSGMGIRSRLVKQSHSTTIAAGTVVKWDAAEYGWGVIPCGADEVPCGVVPSYMPAAVPVGAWFPMIVEGPASIQKVLGEIAEGAFVVTRASGRIEDETAGAYASENDKTEVGRALETSSAAAGSLMRVFVDLP